LDFSSKPAEAVAFFKEHLQPLKIEQKDLDDLLKDLGNDDEKVWKPAFDKLDYFDPRLTEDLSTLMQSVNDQTARNHLAEILSNYPPDQLKGSSIGLTKLNGAGDRYIFRSQGGNGARSWIVESKVARLDVETNFASKKTWVRADRAIVLLQHIGTPDALAILKEMAAGNAEAQPTKIAKVAVESLTSAGVKQP
jgi:hypothetical protein